MVSLGAQSEYTVKPGDTFYGISMIFDIPSELLMSYNGMSDASQLRVDQVLKIPKSYEVKPGDTYYGISKKIGVSVAELLEYNDRTEATILLAGEFLQIPTAIPVVPPQEPSGQDDEPVPPQTPLNGSEEFFWPHGGSRSRLTGKLDGEQFSGTPGDSVVSVSSGNVIWVAPYRGYSKLIIVESPDTHIYAYGGNELSLVKVGDSVFPGMEIGRLGINPHEGEAKAFFFVYKDGSPIDPRIAPRV